MIDIEKLKELIDCEESENLEFKEAKNNFSTSEVRKYCCVLANMKGGYLILGVKEKPREIIGSQVFNGVKSFGDLKRDILNEMQIRIEIGEYFLNSKRLVVFEVPSRPKGIIIRAGGKYLWRVGDSIQAMPLDIIKEIIFKESITDFSAEIIENASMDDLDKDSFLKFMSHSEIEDKLWRPGNVSFQDYLKSIDLITSNNKITIAVLTMFGCKDSIRRFLPQAETIVEYRRDSKSIGSDNRIEYHYGFMGYLDIINDGISSFTGSISYSSGLFRRTLDVFNKVVLREALLNAFCHRDYSDGRSIDIKVSTKELTIDSPGGFPNGITADNIIIRHNSRNRLIAESLQRWGLVERAGQGFDKMWKSSILEAKYGPDVSNTTDNLFSLKLNGSIIDESLLKYMEKKSGTLQSISLQQLIAIHSIAIGAKPRIQTRELNELLKNNLIEKKGVGRGTKYHLPKQFFASNNNRGTYTRLKGLSDRTNKELILKHIDNFRKANIQELEDALGIKRRRIHTLLNSLRADGLIKFEGSKRSGVWIKC